MGTVVNKKTLANITKWPKHVIDGLKRLVKGVELLPKKHFKILSSIPHGHVQAVIKTVQKLKLDSIIFSRPCKERNLVIAMIVQRLIAPCSKLATTRNWHLTTLADELGIKNADENDLYDAMIWLLNRKKSIENKLAKKHLSEDALVLYDISSSYYEGRTCTLAVFGHNRDKKKGKPIIVYGLLTDKDGRPVSVDVYPGNTGDPSTVPDQIKRLVKQFGLSRVVLVGDRGMLTQPKIDLIKKHPNMGWLSALKSQAIRKLIDDERIQTSLFDEENLAEISSPDFPGERLIACFNPILEKRRRHKREALLKATEEQLTKIQKEVARRVNKKLDKKEIGIKVGKVLNKFKMGKHFEMTIKDDLFQWSRKEEAIQKESLLDGIYVVRTNVPETSMSRDDAVRNYKSLSHVERAFRCMKGFDNLIRPIWHHTENHVKAHILICMLSYYVEWHMRKALAPLLFEDEELDQDRLSRDPVATAEPSESVKAKKARKVTEDGLPVHSFNTLLKALALRTKNKCIIKDIPDASHFYQYSELNELQEKAYELLDVSVPR